MGSRNGVYRSLQSRGLAQALYTQFDDGQWHTLEEAVARCGHLIPIELALRRYNGRGLAKEPLSMESRIDTGRRQIISECLRSRKTQHEKVGKWARGRFLLLAPLPKRGGEHHVSAKLTNQIAADVLLANARYRAGYREDEGGFPLRALAETYGVVYSTLQQLCAGESWRHLPRPMVEKKQKEIDARSMD